MCKEKSKQYIMIIHNNTKKSREIAKELSEGIKEQGALYLIQEEKLPSVETEDHSENDQDANIDSAQVTNNDSDADNDSDQVADNDSDDNLISISVGIKDEEISVYYKRSIDIPLIKYDVVDSADEVENNSFKVIGKNVAQLIELKPFINILDDD